MTIDERLKYLVDQWGPALKKMAEGPTTVFTFGLSDRSEPLTETAATTIVTTGLSDRTTPLKGQP